MKDRQTDRQTDIQTGGRTDEQRDRQIVSVRQKTGYNIILLISTHLATIQGLAIHFRMYTEFSRLNQT